MLMLDLPRYVATAQGVPVAASEWVYDKFRGARLTPPPQARVSVKIASLPVLATAAAGLVHPLMFLQQLHGLPLDHVAEREGHLDESSAALPHLDHAQTEC
jgi:hypothetical protein